MPWSCHLYKNDHILDHGVTVTLQILVLSFWVRIPMIQQYAKQYRISTDAKGQSP